MLKAERAFTAGAFDDALAAIRSVLDSPHLLHRRAGKRLACLALLELDRISEAVECLSSAIVGDDTWAATLAISEIAARAAAVGKGVPPSQ